MKWEILILSQPSRVTYLERLLNQLMPQTMAHAKEVDWLVRTFDKSMSLGANRQAMREASTATYQNFVDDDDLVADDYVARILPLLNEVDYVGFRLQAYENGVKLPGPTYHSLLCGGWWDKTFADGTKAWYRDISHLNPIRRELALAVPMWGGFAEDSRWANDLRALGIVRTEHYIEDVMYHYYSRTDKTDGVDPATPLTAGRCPRCESAATVIVEQGRACNACGAIFGGEA